MFNSKDYLIEQVKSKEDLFVDRSEFKNLFWKAYNTIEQNISEEYQVLSLYGFGGIGKTSLLTHICHELQSKNELYIKYDLNSGSIDKKSILYKMSNSFRLKYGELFRFPLFYSALLLIAKNSGDNISLNNDIKTIIKENSWMSILLEDLSIIPVIGTVFQFIKAADDTTAAIRNHFRNEQDINEYNCLVTQMYRLEVNELLERIHIYFSIDMLNNMNRIKKVLVIMLDTYEWLVDVFLKTGTTVVDDYWLRKGNSSVIKSIPGILWVIAGRDALLWESDDEWMPGKLNQYNIQNLEEQYSKEYLEKNGIRDEKIIKDIHSLTKGIPIYLDLCIEQYHLLLEKKLPIDVSTFGNNTDVLLERYTRYLDSASLDMIQMMAAIKHWTNNHILYVGANAKSIRSFSVSRYKVFLNNSMIRRRDRNQYLLHDVVQQAIIRTIDLNTITELQTLSAQYYLSEIYKCRSLTDIEEYLGYVIDYLIDGADIDIISDNRIVEYSIKSLTNEGNYINTYILLCELKKLLEGQKENPVPLANVSFQIAYLEYHRGRYYEAYKDSLESISLLKDNISLKGSLYYNSIILNGKSLVQIGRYFDAIELFNKILIDGSFTEKDENYWDVLKGLGYAYLVVENYSISLEYAKRINDYNTKEYGEEDPRTAESMSFLGWSLIENGKYSEAIKYIGDALRYNLHKYGKFHSEVGSNYNNLGYAYLCDKQYSNALDNLFIAKEIREVVFPEKNSAVARTINNIGRTYLAMDEYKKALSYCELAYEMRMEVYDEEHPEIANSLYFLGIINGKLGDIKTSVSQMELCLKIRKEKLIPSAKDIKETYRALLLLYLESGEYKKYVNCLKTKNIITPTHINSHTS